MTPKIVIIILNWNGYENTHECINSILKISYSNYKILLVDNGSEKKDYEKIISLDSSAEIIRSEQNLGFSGGNNIGIKFALKTGADYLLLLNNDTVVEPDFLEPLLHRFQIESTTGIVTSKINYYSDKNKIWFPGGIISSVHGSGFAYSDQYDDGIKKADSSLAFVSGCCMLRKKEV